MALIHCPECDKEISDKVKACPFCGYPFETEDKDNTDVQQVEIASVKIAAKDPAKMKKILTGVIAAVVILAVGLGVFFVLKNNAENKNYNVYIDNLIFARETMIDGGSSAEAM